MPNRFRFIGLKQGLNILGNSVYERAEIGGKTHGLYIIRQVLSSMEPEFPEITLDIPPLTVLGTSVFDAFMLRNKLGEIAYTDLPDDRIAHAFQNGDMPFEILGELRKIITEVTTPLAIRSSGLLEDTTQRPFAGVYVTKMIPNNQYDPDARFHKLLEAIKFVWASTFFKIAKDYCRATSLDYRDEKMAVIIQEMVGKRHGNRYYPELSGVARSFNYYPIKPAVPQDGVVDLALGLGKTIVDGGKTWSFSPAYPQRPPPFESVDEVLTETQNEFWVVNLGEPPEYDPINEIEYMRQENLQTAESDNVLRYLVSTYDPQSERLSVGLANKGPRALTFAPILVLNEIPLNRLIKDILHKCEEEMGTPVEIEVAMTFDPHHFALLQVRPMVIPTGNLTVSEQDLQNPNNLVASEMVLGNGSVDDITDIVYVKPDRFELINTRKIAEDLEIFNRTLLAAQRPYTLIVFGRLGTFDPWLGIPVSWGQVCGAKVIIEATQDNVKVELSQGSHYFHNIINLGVIYFSMPFASPYRIQWNWLENQPIVSETEFVRHVQIASALKIKVDGRSGRGIICR
ncbi:MAG: PEP/pyruvate-binding domain-containing protein [Leptolinea sp.]